MEYPGSKITKKWRLSILILFIGMFFVLAPTILIYAMGFRYDANSKKLIGRGAISIDIKTNYGNVYLNNIKLKKNYFNKKTEVKNIVPGKYSLKIQTDGYYDWKKNITIEGNKTVYIKEINLIKKNNPKIIINEPISNLALSNDGTNIVYTTLSKTNKSIINIYNTTAHTNRSILKMNTNDEYKIEWENNNTCFYVYGIGQKTTKIICLDNQEIKQFDLVNNIEKLQWKTNARNPEIYYLADKKIQSFTPLTNNINFISKDNFIDWFFEDNQLWTMQINTTTNELEIWKDYLNFKSLFKKIQPIGGLSKNTTSIKQRYSLSIAKNENLLIRDNKADKIIIINKKQEHSLSAQHFLLSTHNDWWIMWNSFEMWTYIENEIPELQTRSGNNLKQVLPIDEYNALLLIWDKSASYLYPYYLVQGELANIPIYQIKADTNNRILYFTRKDKLGLWKLAY